MSRLEEVQEMCKDVQFFDFAMGLAEDLAAEVDARDEVITELLDFIKKTCTVEYNMNGGVIRGSRTHARACEIAGRTE